jgi:hypothetical protein
MEEEDLIALLEKVTSRGEPRLRRLIIRGPPGSIHVA